MLLDRAADSALLLELLLMMELELLLILPDIHWMKPLFLVTFFSSLDITGGQMVFGRGGLFAAMFDPMLTSHISSRGFRCGTVE